MGMNVSVRLWNRALGCVVAQHDSSKKNIEENQALRFAQVLTEVPNLGAMLDCSSLVALQVTCTALRTSLRAPGVWHAYLLAQGQQLQGTRVMLSCPSAVGNPSPSPPPPLREHQCFEQQCAIWYGLQAIPAAHHAYRLQSFRGDTYRAWFRKLAQCAP